MWTERNRGRYDRGSLRYLSDLTDEEWALVEPEIPPAKRGGNRRTVDVRAVIDGLMYVLGTGCQWRAIPRDLPPRSTIRYPRLVVEPMPTPGQGLGVPQPKQTRVPAMGISAQDVTKSLSELGMILDGL